MQRPFDQEIVDALLAKALQGAIRMESLDPANAPFRAEALAAQILSTRHEARALGFHGSTHVSAGFRLAMRLCCRVLADPLRMHPRGVKRDVEHVLTWLERSRDDHKREEGTAGP